MFARVPASAHICLGCRRRLAEATKIDSTSAILFFLQRRVASNAVAKVDEDDDFYTQSSEQEANLVKPSKDLKTWQPKSASGARGRRRSIPTAALGVNSLGKPAEVLLLPAHDRRLPKILDGSTKEVAAATTTLQESLDSEKSPIDPASLSSAIEQARATIKEEGGELNIGEYDALKDHILKSFTGRQLKQYLSTRLENGHLKKVEYEHLEKLGSSNRAKRSMRKNPPLISRTTFHLLCTEVWGLKLPVADLEERSRTLATPKRYHFDLADEVAERRLVNDPRQRLKSIAETFQVTIELSRQQRRIKVTGTKSEAWNALLAIKRILKEKFDVIILPFSRNFSTFSQPALEEATTSFFRRLEDKYSVFIWKTQRDVRVEHLSRGQLAEQAAREIKVAGQASRENYRLHVYRPLLTELMSLERFPTPPDFPWGFSQLPWSRLLGSRSGPSSLTAPSEIATLSKLGVATTKVADFFDTREAFTAPATQPDFRVETTAILGQALFQHPGSMQVSSTVLDAELKRTGIKNSEPNVDLDAVDPDVQADPTSSNTILKDPAFTGSTPYVQQQVSGLKNCTSKAGPAINLATSMTFRLEFLPLSDHKKNPVPSFEVFVDWTPTQKSGERPKLSISRISAIHSEKAFYMLCPEHQVDVKFVQQFKQDLRYGKGNVLDIHKRTCNVITGYVSQSRLLDATNWVFRPMLDIPLDSALLNVQGVAKAAAKHGTEHTQAEDVNHIPKRVHKKKVEYYLRNVEVIDVKSCSLPSSMAPRGDDSPTLSLDSVTLSGPTTTRHELRLSERSLLSPANLDPSTIPALVKGAMCVVEQLGNGMPEATLSLQHSTSFFEAAKSGEHLKPSKSPLKGNSKQPKNNRRNQAKIAGNGKHDASEVKSVQKRSAKSTPWKANSDKAGHPTRDQNAKPPVDQSTKPLAGTSVANGTSRTKTSERGNIFSPPSQSQSTADPKREELKSGKSAARRETESTLVR